MDLDGDGIEDIISGSYWPGHLYFFRGLGDGTFAAGVVLKDAAGGELIASEPWENEHKHNMDSLAAVPFAYDFTGNGALDLLVGNIAGHVMLIPNEGTPTEPKFSATIRARIKAGGEEIKVGGGDSGPIMVDWDGDGLDDLIVGAGDGSVWFYRNIGEKNSPAFEKGIALIAAPGRADGEQLDASAEPTRPGTRLKVHATDYNGNGHLDLLVGDFSTRRKPAPELNDEQTARRDELRKQRDEINEKMQAFYRRAQQGEEGGIDFNELRKDEEFVAVQTKMTDVWRELSQYEAGQDYAGHVWLYLRKVD